MRAEITSATGGEEILPVRWSDNDVTLAPGETLELTALYRAADRTAPPFLRLAGWNLPVSSIAIP